MSPVPPFSHADVESLAKLLADYNTGSEISRILASLSLPDRDPTYTKWVRLNGVFLESQGRSGYSNAILGYVEEAMAPSRYAGRGEEYEARRERLNVQLAFVGVELGSDGKCRARQVARTIGEAEARLQTIQKKFRGRRLHPEVLKYCTVELLQENYFHALLEATKGLAESIRVKSGVQADGADLVDKVFNKSRPILAFNSLQTETEQSEYSGYANLLKGCFGFVRNPRAHEPRIKWRDEDDVADYLTMISLLHRKLDDCVPTGRTYTP